MTGGRAPRQKGDRREREIVQRHRALGIDAQRVPLSGAAGGRFSGDIDINPFGIEDTTLTTEVKARANGEGFVQLERWLGENDAMFLVRDRADPIVVLPWRVWELLLTRIRARYGAPCDD
jgi:Holliday junction resolvase